MVTAGMRPQKLLTDRTPRLLGPGHQPGDHATLHALQSCNHNDGPLLPQGGCQGLLARSDHQMISGRLHYYYLHLHLHLLLGLSAAAGAPFSSSR